MLRAATLPSKEFTTPTPKLGEYVYEQGTYKTVARNIEVTKTLSNHINTVTITMACFDAAAMPSLVKQNLDKPPVPVP